MILQGGDCQPGAVSVRIGMIGNACRLVRRSMDQPARACLSVFSEHLFLVRCPKFLIRLERIVSRQPFHLHRTAIEGGLAAPGKVGVGHAAMINLSAINRLVSMFDKVLRQSNDFWIQFTEVGRVLDHTDPVGSAPVIRLAREGLQMDCWQ